MREEYEDHLDSRKSCKLTVRAVQVIRSMAEDGFELSEIAHVFQVSGTTISRVVNYQTWKMVD